VSNLFSELKRRNVFRVAAAYAVVGWLLIQIATSTFPVLEIPNWAIKLVIALVLLGLPIALLLAWAFELTPEGIVRADEVPPGKSIARKTGRKLVVLIAVAALLAVALLIFQFTRTKTAAANAKSPTMTAKSIAVLPFENLSRDPDNAFFADGIQDEILSTLGKINDLRVISRTSTAKYKSRPDNLRQVATELGAATILEGSVQRATDRVRVIVQLIDATTDAHLWSDTYDRELKDIFSVQSEIAQKIATSLKTKLSADDKQSLGQLPTQSAEAYELYLKAGYFVRQVDAGNGDPAHAIPQAIALYQEAIAKDPGFALAYARMSHAHSWAHWFSVDDSPERVQLAEEAARKALALNPQLSETHLAAGYVAYWGRRDYAPAMAEFEFARKILPNDGEVAIAIGSIHRRRGEWEAAVREFSRAATFDPRNPNIPESIAYSFAPSRRYGEALGYLERALTVQPDYWGALCGIAAFQALSSGDVAQAKAAFARVPANVDPTGQVRYSRFRVAMWLGQSAEAVKLLDSAPDWIRTNPAHRPVATSSLRGQAFEAASQPEAARAAFAAAIPLLEEKIRSGGGEPSLHLSLGRAYAGMGRKEDALREGRKAVESLPVSRDAFDGPSYLEQFAQIQARVGNTDEAISLLRQLLQMNAGLVLSPRVLRLDPAWDSLRNDARFQTLCEDK
jgi:TolB-like protein/Tfp pilus assembly protein PilF